MRAVECMEARLRLDRYLDRTLPVEEAEAIRIHLERCATCRMEVGALEELLQGLHDADLERLFTDEPAPLPDDFTARVILRAAADRPAGQTLPRSRFWPRWSCSPYASAAYALSVTLMVVSAGNRLFLWTEGANLLTVWSGRLQGWWESAESWIGLPARFLEVVWQGMVALLTRG